MKHLLLLLLLLATACGGTVTNNADCGGPNDLKCGTGEACMRNGPYPNALGKCVSTSGAQCAAAPVCGEGQKQVTSCRPGQSCNYVSICGSEILCEGGRGCAGPDKIECSPEEVCLREGRFPDAAGTCASNIATCRAIPVCNEGQQQVTSCDPKQGDTCEYKSLCGTEILCHGQIACGGAEKLPCAPGETCLRNGLYPDAKGVCFSPVGPICAAVPSCPPNRKEVKECGLGKTCNYVSLCGVEILCEVI